ncbi:hypothetical protein [Novosphingobium resinovorum]|uniref:hypothetical protein n=1 Tax=Novosphingobium resinovorum TaxID=158500 RepID=UPI002ED09773|nr:hypothetical protein [Novosphingobium resinovorum]
MAEFESLDGDDDWDQAFADDLIGCTLLVGLTYLAPDDTVVDSKQVFGTVDSVDMSAGIVIRQHADGEPFTIAPLLDAIDPADPGVYQLRDEDEAVENPDFTALITVRAPLRS